MLPFLRIRGSITEHFVYSARSGFSFLPHPDGILLHGKFDGALLDIGLILNFSVGGYCKEYVKGQRPVGVMLEDTWLLRYVYPSHLLPAVLCRSQDIRPNTGRRQARANNIQERRKGSRRYPGHQVAAFKATLDRVRTDPTLRLHNGALGSKESGHHVRRCV